MQNKLIAITLTAATLAPVASADTEFSFPFSYDATELQTAEGREALLKRLDDRIVEACTTDFNVSILRDRFVSRKCVFEARSNALDQINSSQGRIILAQHG